MSNNIRFRKNYVISRRSNELLTKKEYYVPLTKQEFIDGIYDGIMVKEKYRGNGIQLDSLNLVEKYALDRRITPIVLCVHKDNTHSINNILISNYQRIKTINIHNSQREIFKKNIVDKSA